MQSKPAVHTSLPAVVRRSVVFSVSFAYEQAVEALAAGPARSVAAAAIGTAPQLDTGTVGFRATRVGADLGQVYTDVVGGTWNERHYIPDGASLAAEQWLVQNPNSNGPMNDAAAKTAFGVWVPGHPAPYRHAKMTFQYVAPPTAAQIAALPDTPATSTRVQFTVNTFVAGPTTTGALWREIRSNNTVTDHWLLAAGYVKPVNGTGANSAQTQLLKSAVPEQQLRTFLTNNVGNFGAFYVQMTYSWGALP
jgi:hypothetical protein